MHRFFVSKPVQGNAFLLDDPRLIHQLKNVLRIQPGEEIMLFDASEKEFRARIASYEKKGILVDILSMTSPLHEPKIFITLSASLLRGNHFEWILQKGTELGVSQFVPVMAARCEKRNLRKDRAQRILQEATEQCGRTKIPELSSVTNFSNAIQASTAPTLFLHITGKPLLQYAPLLQKEKQVNIFIGPEGDWTPEEIEIAKNKGAMFANIGTTILRAETAAIVAAGIVANIR